MYSFHYFGKLCDNRHLLRFVSIDTYIFQAGSARRLSNYKEDIRDSEIYIILLKQIAPPGSGVNMLALTQEDLMERAEEMLKMAEIINCRYATVCFC